MDAGTIRGTLDADEAARNIVDNIPAGNKEKFYFVTFFCSGENKMFVQKYANNDYASYLMFGYSKTELSYHRKAAGTWRQ